MGYRQSRLVPTAIRGVLGGLLVVEGLGAVGIFRFVDKPIWLGVFATNLSLWAAFELIWWRERILKRKVLPTWAAGLALILVLADAGGNLLDWYARFLMYDTWLHFFGGFVGTLVLAEVFVRGLGLASRQQDLWKRIAQAFLVTMVLGIFVEGFELAADAWYQVEFWSGGFFDTLIDLAANGAGGLVAAASLWLLRHATK